MLKSLSHRLKTLSPYLQQSSPLSLTPVRCTVIVKRVHKPPLVTLPGRSALETPQHLIDKQVIHSDDDKWMIYEVEEKHQEDYQVKVILLRNVDDFGVKGQIISAPYYHAHVKLILPGFAVYHTEENLERLGDFVLPENQIVDSSETAKLFVNYYSKRIFDICMNNSTPWTIDKWHIKASLRRHKVWATEDQIEIPGGEICGPDTSLQDKEFIAVLTVNNHERVKIRCRIHHLLDENDDMKRSDSYYLKMAEPVWEHERSQLLDMNRAPPNKAFREDNSLAEYIEKFDKWRRDREERLA